MIAVRVAFLLLFSAVLAFNASADDFYQAAPVGNFIDDLVNQTINSLLESIPEPVEVSSLAFNLNNNLIAGSANISDFSLSGLTSLLAPNITTTLAPITLNATLQISKIALNTKYNADLIVGSVIALYGHGRVGVTIEGVEVLIVGGLDLSNGLTLTNVTIALSLGEAVFDLHGLLDDDEFSALVSEVLTDNVALFIDEYKEVISNLISPLAEDIINSILHAGSNSTTILE